MSIGFRLLGAGCVFIGGFLIGVIMGDEDFRRTSDIWGYAVVLGTIWVVLGVGVLGW